MGINISGEEKFFCVLCKQPAPVTSLMIEPDKEVPRVFRCEQSCWKCDLLPFQEVRFHPACYALFITTYEASRKLPSPLDWQRLTVVTTPRYICLRNDNIKASTSLIEGLFSKHAEKILKDVFRKDLLEKLPTEILLEICEVMGSCWYLTVLGESQRLMGELKEKGDPQPASLDLNQTRTVWISRITYRGVSYVSRLRDKPLRFTKRSDQIQLPLPSRTAKIVASVDGIGVRGIYFLEHTSDTPPPDGSPWYEILPVHHTNRTLFVSSNDLFIKKIYFERQRHGVPYIWSSPCPPTVHLRNLHHEPEDSLDDVRVHYIKFDHHVRGLLVCCEKYGLVGIHGLTDTSTKFRAFVDLMHRRIPNSHKYWMYFPFNRQETIIAAWLRKCAYTEFDDCPPLVLLTSRGRTVTFGPQFRRNRLGSYRYELLGGLHDGPISGIFHDGLNIDIEITDNNYIRDMGVTCDTETSVEAQMTLPADIHMEPPAFATDKSLLPNDWYMTAASLTNIAKAQICRDTEQPHRPCLGLLLFYHDGHVEAVGQVRWDRDVSETIDQPMYIVNASIDGNNYIKHVLGRVYASELTWDGDTWQSLPESGTIRWWFSMLGDLIKFD